MQRCGGLALPCSVYRPTLLYTTMSRAKTAEPIEMPSGRQTRVSPSKRVFVLHLDRLPGEGKFIYFFGFCGEHTAAQSVHQAAKLAAGLLRVAGVTAGLAESNGSLPPGL